MYKFCTKNVYKNLLVIPIKNGGNYVNLHEGILKNLENKKIEPPYYFLMENKITGLFCYVGVKEFMCERNGIEVPEYLVDYMDSEKVNITLVGSIPKGKSIKIECLDESLYDIPEYDKFLESELSKYCLLNENQKLKIEIMGKYYEIRVKNLTIDLGEEIEYNLIDIVNVDLNVDFIRKEIIKFCSPL